MTPLNKQIANSMEQQQAWIAEKEQENLHVSYTEDKIIQDIAEQFGLGITRQGGNY